MRPLHCSGLAHGVLAAQASCRATWLAPPLILQNYKVQTAPAAKDGGGEVARVVATAPAEPLHVPAAGCTLRYATLSQRGYYPDTPNKANQDAVVVVERLGGRADTHLWGVFDGHGEFGAECAQFVQSKVRRRRRRCCRFSLWRCACCWLWEDAAPCCCFIAGQLPYF